MELRKKFVVRHEDREVTTTLVRDSSGRVWIETAGGERIHDAIVLDGGRTVSIRLDGRMFVVDLTPRTPHELRALVNGKGGAVSLYDELGAAAADAEASGASARELDANMPGLVVALKCAVGDTVSKGQPLVVLEAMKMQNELASPGDGVVEEILVQAGQSVDGGTVLLRLAEPPESSDGVA